MIKSTYHICEYGSIRCLDDFSGVNSLEEIFLSRKHFESLFKYISENQDESSDAEKPFSLHSKGSRKLIRVKNYVGVIETNDGLSLEILPKIHLSKDKIKSELDETKSIFLKMLKHLKNSPFVNVSNAHLESKKNFPILEVFIQSFIGEAETLVSKGIKNDYIQNEDNINFLKGKLLIDKNIKYNNSNRARFYCEFTEYSQNISHNKILKTTLLKLLKTTTSYNSYSRIMRLLSHFEEVEIVIDSQKEFRLIKSSDRLYRNYQTLMDWSEIFLNNQSFTNFSGSNYNMAILYPMERLFEDYISHLFSKYSNGFKIKLQDKSYFLVEQNGIGKFGLKPDIVLNEPSSSKKIIDTKWKLLDQFAERKNYNISQADMYQLYAYGKKYVLSGTEPRLFLLYPSNPNFTNALDNFIYEGDLKLRVVPFDFNDNEELQIRRIIES